MLILSSYTSIIFVLIYIVNHFNNNSSYTARVPSFLLLPVIMFLKEHFAICIRIQIIMPKFKHCVVSFQEVHIAKVPFPNPYVFKVSIHKQTSCREFFLYIRSVLYLVILFFKLPKLLLFPFQDNGEYLLIITFPI